MSSVGLELTYDEDTQYIGTRFAELLTPDCPDDDPSVLVGKSGTIVPV
jgi:hypothetical protein